MNMNGEDDFPYWLMDMDDALERFKVSLAQDVARAADLSFSSLANMEAHFLAEFSSVEQALATESALHIDGYARYLGEALRLYLGGTWSIDFSDKKYAFYGLPQLSGKYGKVCPLTLVTAAADRRTGLYWSTLANNLKKRLSSG